MSDSYLERVAGEIATLALADEVRTQDTNIVNEIAEILGSSSQTLQEAFLTAVRVRRAEERARALLAQRAGEPVERTAAQIKAESSEPASVADEEPTAEEAAADEPAAREAEEPEEVSEEDAAFADVLSTLDEFLQEEEEAAEPSISPKRPQRR